MDKAPSTKGKQSPRVPNEKTLLPPRVQIEHDEADIGASPLQLKGICNGTPSVPASILQQRGNLPKNLRFKNQTSHKYHLWSKEGYMIPEDLVAQHLFDP